ncbi:Arylacetamide deacetylase [Handroanthus impetiginosus]|uniref:Arylacetamide deacetylase n=1 Tax=Handroanthus impetiginosus TaxID=429701 RepID=A0A2G9GGW6_9LAMI|nr:Arylacetamide deacetylase [Handroanthus impetiginosus]
MSSKNTPPIDPNIDPYAYIGIIPKPDGSITRLPEFIPTCAPSSDQSDPIPVLSKDIPINQEKNTWARLYLPRLPESSAAASPTKLPLIVYYHGGGFILGSAATLLFQKFITEIANEVPAVVVSVEYRLAPEHRLPAAYDDCVEALHWIRTTDEEWLTKHADFSKCFLLGTSAGGNIVYHVGLRAITCVDHLMPLKIKGLILHHPFFGGVERSQSEIRLVNDKKFPPSLADLMWDLCLPIGADRDHEYCNPMKGIKLKLLEDMKKDGWKFLVTGWDGDMLIDRQIELVSMLKERGIEAIGKFSEGGSHGVELADDAKANIFYGVLKDFVVSL